MLKEEHRIIKTKTGIERGINQLIERYLFLGGTLNRTSANSEDETLERIKIINEVRALENHLRTLGIQSFEIKSDLSEVEIW